MDKVEQVKEQAVEYLKPLLLGLIDQPEQLKIEAITDHRGLNLVVRASEPDVALLIGKSGTVILSLRKLMQLWGRKNTASVNVFVPSTRIVENYHNDRKI